MSLALRMGRTLGELRQSMTANELMMWAEYDRLSPIGDVRGDILAAQIVSAAYGAQGAKVSIEDSLIQWSDDSGSAENEADPFAALEAALLNAV
ncbi:phage tail assembly protein T [Erwinia sp. SLM-02]|uniref:phage tail assembly protein T n=1 Tax=Erwinia sp. SLM-02 TaxID=3020057 RepID=UPI003080EBAE